MKRKLDLGKCNEPCCKQEAVNGLYAELRDNYSGRKSSKVFGFYCEVHWQAYARINEENAQVARR